MIDLGTVPPLKKKKTFLIYVRHFVAAIRKAAHIANTVESVLFL